jgi:hypothetical protein
MKPRIVTIGQLARRVGLGIDTGRFYERQGWTRKERRDEAARAKSWLAARPGRISRRRGGRAVPVYLTLHPAG